FVHADKKVLFAPRLLGEANRVRAETFPDHLQVEAGFAWQYQLGPSPSRLESTVDEMGHHPVLGWRLNLDDRGEQRLLLSSVVDLAEKPFGLGLYHAFRRAD